MKIDSYNICFIGRTGNGKSSLINAIFGTTLNTDPLISCTKDMQVIYKLGFGSIEKEAVAVFDTPGIGEFSSNDKYMKYYAHAISEADCIVLVTTFDRTDAPAQRLLLELKKYVKSGLTPKFVIALNHIDSKIVGMLDSNYVPWDITNNVPTEACMDLIKERESVIHDKFDGLFLPFEIIPVCATRGYNINQLKEAIL